MKQKRSLSYGAVTNRQYNSHILFGRKLMLTVESWNEEENKYDNPITLDTGMMVGGFKSKTTKKKTRWQKRAKVGKDMLVFRWKWRDRSKYNSDGSLRK